MKRMPGAPPRTRLRREVQAAALPSMSPPGRADGEPVQAGQDRSESQELRRRPSAPAEGPLESCVKLPRYTLHAATPDLNVWPHVEK